VTGIGVGGRRLVIALLIGFIAHCANARTFRFDRDTLSFTNMTVFEYSGGRVQSTRQKDPPGKQRRYTRRCFIMSRAALQFYKFARFAPSQTAPNDVELARRVREVCHMNPWKPELPEDRRIVFPGYRDLRALSEARGRVLQDNLGLGWPTYVRVGNYRMFFLCYDRDYQVKEHKILAETMDRHGFFVAYLSDFPHLKINHSVLVYGRKQSRPGSDLEHFITYDPNHPDGPRELTWSNSKREFGFQKDEEFAGGFTHVFQVYGKWMQ
jgi:hypothetical protein